MVLLKRKVDIDEIRAFQKLHDHAGCDDGAHPKFHEGAPVGGKDDTHPIDWIRRVGEGGSVSRQ